MKNIIFFITVIISIIGYSQEDIKVGLFGGPDFSLLKPPAQDSIESKSVISPFFGVEMFYPIGENSSFHLGGFYSVKSSIDYHYIKYYNYFFSVFSNYNYHFSKDFGLVLGPQYSLLLKAQSAHGSEKASLGGYQSYMSINAGINFRLQSHLTMDLLYEYPINNPYLANWPSIKLKLSLIVDKTLFKRDQKKAQQVYSNVKRKELKRSALLVSLRGYKRQIEAYKKNGDNSMVMLLTQKRDSANQSIMNAFATEFDYCPVYFFYNYDAKKIKHRNFKGIFLNRDLEKDSTIIFSKDTFLIGEMGYNITELKETYGYTDVYKNGFNLAEGYAKSSTIESDISHYGFYIRNQDLTIIDKPFPSFVSRRVFIFKRTNRVIIRQLNEKLKNYQH